MFYYEIKNVKTQETTQATAKSFKTACEMQGWKSYHCKCIWKTAPENACHPSDY